MATTKNNRCLVALSGSRYTDHDIIVSFEQKHCKKPVYYIHIRVYFKVVELHIIHPGIPFNMWFCRDVAILIRSPTRWSCADLRKPNLEHSCAWSATWIHVKDLEVKKGQKKRLRGEHVVFFWLLARHNYTFFWMNQTIINIFSWSSPRYSSEKQVQTIVLSPMPRVQEAGFTADFKLSMIQVLSSPKCGIWDATPRVCMNIGIGTIWNSLNYIKMNDNSIRI